MEGRGVRFDRFNSVRFPFNLQIFRGTKIEKNWIRIEIKLDLKIIILLFLPILFLSNRCNHKDRTISPKNHDLLNVRYVIFFIKRTNSFPYYYPLNEQSKSKRLSITFTTNKQNPEASSNIEGSLR